MDGTIIASIVTGAFGIVYLILQPLLTFVKSEKEDGVKTYHCFPRCRCCRYKIPKDDNIYPNILTKCWEPPDNWSPLNHTNDCEDSDKKSRNTNPPRSSPTSRKQSIPLQTHNTANPSQNEPQHDTRRPGRRTVAHPKGNLGAGISC